MHFLVISTPRAEKAIRCARKPEGVVGLAGSARQERHRKHVYTKLGRGP
jgi:hypothetical protein